MLSIAMYYMQWSRKWCEAPIYYTGGEQYKHYISEVVSGLCDLAESGSIDNDQSSHLLITITSAITLELHVFVKYWWGTTLGLL